MLNRSRLEELSQSGESETLEFKRSTGQRREAARAIKDDLALQKQLGFIDTAGHGRGAYWRAKGQLEVL